MEVNSGYVNLDYVVSSFLIETEMDDRYYEKIMQKAIEGLLELEINDTLPNIKTAILTVDNSNVAKFPVDYINYISISIENNGRLVPLTQNRNIILPTVESCGEWVRNSITNTNGQFDDITADNEPYSDNVHYTIGGGFNAAYYRIDEANKQIVFLKSNYNGLTIILDYKGVGLGSSNIIPRDAVFALKSFMHWQVEEHRKGANESAIYRKQTNWRTEKAKLYARRHSFTMSEFMDKRYENTHRGLK